MYFEPQSGGLCRKHAVNMAVRNLGGPRCPIIRDEAHLVEMAERMGKAYRVDSTRLLTEFDAVMTDGSVLPSWCLFECCSALVTINVPRSLFMDTRDSAKFVSMCSAEAIGALVYNEGHIWCVTRTHELDSLRRGPSSITNFTRYFTDRPNRTFGFIFIYKDFSKALNVILNQLQAIKTSEPADTKMCTYVLKRPLDAVVSEADRNRVLARWGQNALWIAQSLRLGYKYVNKAYFDGLSKGIFNRYYVLDVLSDEDLENFTNQLCKLIINGLTHVIDG